MGSFEDLPLELRLYIFQTARRCAFQRRITKFDQQLQSKPREFKQEGNNLIHEIKLATDASPWSYYYILHSHMIDQTYHQMRQPCPHGRDKIRSELILDSLLIRRQIECRDCRNPFWICEWGKEYLAY